MFAHTYDHQTMDEQREIAVRRINTIIDKEFVTLADVSLVLSNKKHFTFQPI